MSEPGKHTDAGRTAGPATSDKGIGPNIENHTEIAPLNLDFSELDAVDDIVAGATLEADSQSASTWLLPTIIGLVIAAATVIFALPTVFSPTDQVAEQTEEAELITADVEKIDEGSPFQEAKLAQQRKNAQDSLEQILEKQLWLEKRNVQLWAGEEYQRSFELAAQGDEYYRNRQFEKANNLYSEGLAIVTKLLEGMPDRISSNLDAGLQALLDNDAETAEQSFVLIQAIKPDHKGAEEGMQRLAVLPSVSKALQMAERYQAELQLPSALSELRAVVELDPVRESLLSERIAQLEQAILDRNFEEQMSQGYQSLDQGNRSAAAQFFTQANKLKPDSTEPKKALRMVRNQQALNRMSVHIDEARDLEREEQWADAVKSYDAALSIDANLTDAANRRAKAVTRMKMDQALVTLNDDPLRLADNTIYAKAAKIHAAGTRVSAAGPRLTQQLELLNKQLQASRISLPVLIESDGFTQVALSRIARLGVLQQKKLSLIPGRYVVTGSRDGYRDVRREFEVPQGARNVQVDIRCVEQI